MVTKDQHLRLLYRAGVITSFLTLIACASPVPELIKSPPANMPLFTQVQQNPQQYTSQKVRWGGYILATENRASSTRLTILGLPLYGDGEPKIAAGSEGRFIAVFPVFLEPQVYVKNRKITVMGRLQDNEVVQIGDYPYTHPVVQVDAHYLWPVETNTGSNDWPPLWYDPWYHPFYYPYYYPYHFPHRHY